MEKNARKLLRIDSSPRGNDSLSSRLSDLFCELWEKGNPGAQIIVRHVGLQPPKHPTLEFIQANSTPPAERSAQMIDVLKESDALIDELLNCDEYVFSVPMYNFSLPSTLKAYIDNVVRAGKTFNVSDSGTFIGCLNNKRMTVISTRGAKYTSPSPLASFDMMTPYLRTVMGFMGVLEVDFIIAEDLDFSTDAQRISQLENAKRFIKARFY